MSNQRVAVAPRPDLSTVEVSLASSGQVREGLVRDIAGDTANTEQRRQIRASHEKTLRESAGKKQAAAAEENLPAVVEDFDAIQIELPDGRLVDLIRPPAGTLNYKIALALGNDASNPMLNNIARAMAYVSHIDEAPAPAMTGKVEFMKLQDLLGETAVDLICVAVNTTWPSFAMKMLKIVKKTPRIPTSGR